LPESTPKTGLSAPKIHSEQNPRRMERSLLLFRESIKTEVTFQVYLRRLKEFMSFCNVEMDSDQEVLRYGIRLILFNVGMCVGIPILVIMRFRM